MSLDDSLSAHVGEPYVTEADLRIAWHNATWMVCQERGDAVEPPGRPVTGAEVAALVMEVQRLCSRLDGIAKTAGAP